MTRTPGSSAFDVQSDVRAPWRRYVDALASFRPALHGYCCRLTGNVWDGEDLLQDTLLRVFGLLGKIDRDLENPKAYLIRTATHLWIDQQRRRALDRAFRGQHTSPDERSEAGPEQALEAERAMRGLITLAPRERAAVLLCEVLDLTANEAGALLQISAGAVKAALHRARGRRLDPAAVPDDAANPPKALVERFLAALSANDLDAMRQLCNDDVVIELVGGAASDGFDDGRTFFAHAHWEPGPEMAAIARAMRMGIRPRWQLALYRDEWLVLGFRTYDGVEGLNEVHRLDVSEDRIARIRCYCFCPDTLRALGAELGIVALERPYRSPDPASR